MHRFIAFVVFALSACIGPTASLRNDPALVQRVQGAGNSQLLIDLLTGKPDAAKQIEEWLDQHSDAAGSNRAAVLALLCEDQFRRSKYSLALESCRRADFASGRSMTASLQALLEPLKGVPPPGWTTTGATIPLFKDIDGVRRLYVGPASDRIEAVLDTGAEVSVMMESVARRLGVTTTGVADLETTTTPVVGSVGILSRLQIGDSEVLNLPVLVLPDEQLRFPDGGSIPIVLGLPVLIEAGRFAVRGHGSQLVIGTRVDLPSSNSATQLYWDPSGMGMAAEFGSAIRAVHFDSGSGRTYLYPSAMTAVSKAERATRQQAERVIAGLGGARREKSTRLDSVIMTIAGHDWSLAPIEVAEHDENGEAARIGAALFDRFENVTIDFKSMRMWLGD